MPSRAQGTVPRLLPPAAAISFAFTTVRIADKTAIEGARSWRSNTGCLTGATWASNLLQLTARCASPLPDHGRTRVLLRERRNPHGQTRVPELPRRIRG